jgi:hypothetical protein
VGEVAERVTFRPAYAVVAVILFAVEVFIALSLHDGFVRPYVGDVLAVMLVYCALRAVTPLRTIAAITTTLVFAFAVELAQLFNLLDFLALRGNAAAETVLGGSFDLFDLVAYAIGALIIVAAESIQPKVTP